MDIKKFLTNQQQLLEMTATQEARNKELEDAYRVKKKTIDLLPNAEENIVTLEGVVDASSERLVKLATKWEEHRGPLIGEYRHLKAAHTASLVSCLSVRIVSEFRYYCEAQNVCRRQQVVLWTRSRP